MIHSMTGFGTAETTHDGVHYRVEIRSLNNRYFKSAIKLPEQLQRFEGDVDRQLRSRLNRGSVTYTLRVKDETPLAAYEINKPVLLEYVRQLEEAVQPRDKAHIDLARLLEAPGVCQPAGIDDAILASRHAVVERLTEEAIDKVIAMRRAEGEALLRDLQTHCEAIRMNIAAIGIRSPVVVDEYRTRLNARAQQLMSQGVFELEKDAVAREVAIFAEKCDINEEVARTGSHLDQFAALCDGDDEAGRKLDFLAQEMQREANTIGSKANDAEISRHVVELKGAIDRIKEQVQNVE
jgi:uncharacterized protein (TIGR00255 family)